MKVQLNVQVELPFIPNHLKVVKGGVGAGTVSLGELSDDAVEDVIKEWGNAIRQRAKQQRNSPIAREEDGRGSI
jgi:hypothetical protein